MSTWETFGIFTDEDCTIEYSGFEDLVHQTDLSDGDQDIGPLYLGSPVVDPVFRELEDTSDPGVNDIILSIVDILPDWEAATAYVLGDCVQPTVNNGKRYICTTAGTSHAATEPTWPLIGIGTTVTDGTAVWALAGAKHETTEVKLALTEVGLDSAVAGASLNLGPTIESDPANAVTIYMRVTNAVVNISNNTATPEIDIQISSATEFEA
jgi:hypothetical protein